MSKQPPNAPIASAVGPCPTVIQIVGRPGTGSLPRAIAPPDHPLYATHRHVLTRCYTQHALRPVIDFKINHIRHFIKIPFINKGMDFIDLPSIFRDKSVQSSIPNYFKNCEVPIICYEYNKPIRGAIVNFNKLVSGLDIETCTPDS